MNNRCYKKAFTLAETLITLSIIGIVAAIVIPALVANYQEYQFKQAAKEAYSKASQAVQQIKMDNGGTLANYYSTFRTFKPVFMKYFKYIKDCNWYDCVNTTSNPYHALNSYEGFTHQMDEGQFVTADGMFWGIDNFADGTISITVDVNGYEKKPDIFGKDTFTFAVINGNVVPMGMKGTTYGTPAYCDKNNTTVSFPAQQGMACMYYVMQGIDY